MIKNKIALFSGYFIFSLFLFGMFNTANADYQYGDFMYYINDDGTATISEWIGPNVNAVVPSEVDGYTVTKIGLKAFNPTSKEYSLYFDNSLESVEIPDSVTFIDEGAFYACQKLNSVELPYGLTSIEAWTFGYTNIDSIEIPDTVTTIGENAFFGSKVTTLEIPDSVTTIEYQALASPYLETAVIPSSVTWIADDIFQSMQANFVTVYVEEGSCAEQYCKDNQIHYESIDDLYGEDNYDEDDDEYDEDYDEYEEDYTEEEEPVEYQNCDLSQFIGVSFDDFIPHFSDLSLVKDEPDEEKWECEYMSVTGLGHDTIVRIRFSDNPGNYNAYGVSPGMPVNDAYDTLESNGLKHEATTEDGWTVFKSQSNKLIAYCSDEDLVSDIYIASPGYLSISY